MIPKINFSKLTDIDPQKEYFPGRLTLTYCPDAYKVPFVLLVWKIDDPVWKIRTANRDKISETDDKWKEGVFSFTSSSHSWSYGMDVNLMSENFIKDTYNLRDRIMRLTREVGIEIEYCEFTTEKLS